MSFKTKHFRRGESLTEEGLPSEFIYLVKQGRVEIRKGVRRTSPIVLGTVGPGETIGEVSVYDGNPSLAEAVAIEDTETLAMSKEEFHKRLEGMDPIFNGLFRMLIQRTRSLADQVEDVYDRRYSPR